ncbi:MAG TPA: pyrimidine 5'-nucleotidase [Myxococcota bacterium]|jgi:putative hydrolase of the HAD superfamily|nr:pyrimidine 5'-nucleotidase [Myxococcota bacterium]
MLASAPVDVLLIDLDDTLYPAESGVLPRLDERINAYLREELGVPAGEVDGLRRSLRNTHGTTLHGLMARHPIDRDHYLRFVHDADLSDLLRPDPALRALLARVPGRKLVFTNAPRAHARNVLALLDVADAFEAVIAIEDHDYLPKPNPVAFERALARAGVAAEACAFVDDTRQNVLAARRLGMHGVWVAAAEHHAHPEAQPVIASIHELEEALRR